MGWPTSTGTCEPGDTCETDSAPKISGAARATEDFGVLVGWTHRSAPHGINLGLQSARSQAAWAGHEIDRRHYLLTPNQALLLARYLLEATGQEIALPGRRKSWRSTLAGLGFRK